jgi:hypothetical protein
MQGRHGRLQAGGPTREDGGHRLSCDIHPKLRFRAGFLTLWSSFIFPALVSKEEEKENLWIAAKISI